MRVPLVDGQGNFGSVDGDQPAAMRYTEVRPVKIAHASTEDIETVMVELEALRRLLWRKSRSSSPARFPESSRQWLERIAVGMATKIPPTILGEVIDAVSLISPIRRSRWTR